MPSTTPASLAGTSWSGDTEETAITNDPANKGFPARTQGGELIFIVKTVREHQTKVLIDADGNRYVDDNPQGVLVPYSSEQIEDGDAEADPTAIDEIGAQEMTENASDIEGYIVHEVSPQNEAGTTDEAPTADDAAPPADAAA